MYHSSRVIALCGYLMWLATGFIWFIEIGVNKIFVQRQRHTWVIQKLASLTCGFQFSPSARHLGHTPSNLALSQSMPCGVNWVHKLCGTPYMCIFAWVSFCLCSPFPSLDKHVSFFTSLWLNGSAKNTDRIHTWLEALLLRVGWTWLNPSR